MVERTAVALIKGSLHIFRDSAREVALELYREVFRAAPAVRCLFSLDFLNVRSTKECPLRSHGDSVALYDDDTLVPPLSAQAQILADSIVGFCASVDDLASFEPAIDRICAKHVSRQIQPGHYTVVTEAFSAATRTVLGDKLSAAELAAWDAAVVFLAGVLIKRESEFYKERANIPGGWEGFRQFYVASRLEESSSSALLQLCPSDKSKLQEYRSSQYVCLRLASHKYGLIHSNINLVPRRTSFAQPSLTHYEVKISYIATPSIHGTNTFQCLLDEMKEGATIELSAPIGGYLRCPGRSIIGPRGMSQLPHGSPRARPAAGFGISMRSPLPEGTADHNELSEVSPLGGVNHLNIGRPPSSSRRLYGSSPLSGASPLSASNSNSAVIETPRSLVSGHVSHMQDDLAPSDERPVIGNHFLGTSSSKPS